MATNPARQAVLDALAMGETVVHREHGSSMVPIIRSGEPVTLTPVRRHLDKDDVVLVKVNGRIYLHKILALRHHKGTSEVQIGNNRGGVNGWTSGANVYGVVTHVDGRAYKPSRNRGV